VVNHLDMGRVQELVDRHDARDAVAAIDEDAEIARERPRIAGDGTTSPPRRRIAVCAAHLPAADQLTAS
jgi:hypothetical protein